jgi:hypothetical protein
MDCIMLNEVARCFCTAYKIDETEARSISVSECQGQLSPIRYDPSSSGMTRYPAAMSDPPRFARSVVDEVVWDEKEGV